MSVGLPDHLARTTSARALAAAAHAAGLTALGFALANVVITAMSSGRAAFLLTGLTIVPMAGLLVLLSQRRTLLVSVAYLAVGAACTFLYAWSLLVQTPSYHDTSLFVFALPVIAMALVGGAGSGALLGVLWCSLGLGLAETMLWAAASAAGREYVPNVVSLCAYLMAVTVLFFEALSRRGRRAAQSAVYRGAKTAQLLRVRQELAVEAAAHLHDTTISELITVARSDSGPLSPALRARIETDLIELGRDRVSEGRPGGGVSADRPWLDSELHQAIDLVRQEGLDVEVSGEEEALGRLAPDTRHALALAVRQCLLNVLRHSGSDRAEVALSASPDELTVLVIDAGRGFAEPGTQRDRLGLRYSVRDRIERVGGHVTIWSSPGAGTTVMLVVPCELSATETPELIS